MEDDPDCSAEEIAEEPTRGAGCWADDGEAGLADTVACWAADGEAELAGAVACWADASEAGLAAVEADCSAGECVVDAACWGVDWLAADGRVAGPVVDAACWGVDWLAAGERVVDTAGDAACWGPGGVAGAAAGWDDGPAGTGTAVDGRGGTGCRVSVVAAWASGVVVKPPPPRFDHPASAACPTMVSGGRLRKTAHDLQHRGSPPAFLPAITP